MRVLVFGLGAMGSLFAARFVPSGHVVIGVGRADHVAAIRAHGLRVEGRTDGVYRLEAFDALPAHLRPEIVVLAVKGPDVARAARALVQGLEAPTPIVALQNGLGVEAQLLPILAEAGWPEPAGWIVRGTNSYGATLLEAGRLRHAGDGEILLPEASDAVPPPRLALAEALFRSGGFQVRRVPDLPRELWRKLLVNAAINPVTADHGVLNGALLKDPLRGQAEQLLREAQVAARLEGFDFPDDEADAQLWKVVRTTAENRSSMLQDLDHHRPTEIDAISGEVERAGARHGIALAATHRAIERIRAREHERHVGSAAAASAP